ncbi:MAG: peptidylprolyl isomerase [Candidatus Margulisbacteria bacterium]|nr:peptidylprolyl isomerase [Candidatus Margulisiibacteriota bacterium]
MLEFMRTRAREIVMVTVLLFVVSLFSFGAFSFFNRNNKSGNKKENVKISKIAMVNGEPVDESRFYRQLNQFFSAVPADRRILLDPDVVDFYRYDALQKTISFMVMLDEAKKQGIRAFPQEINYRIDQIAKMYQLKNARELKKILIERKIPWNDFKKEQREEIMVAKFVNGISSRATVTDIDKKMAFTEVHARHILIKDEETTQNASNVSSDIKALKKAESIYEMVLANRDKFAEIAKKYSDDKLTADKGGDLGWISRGQMVQEFEKQLYKMKPGDIAGPIKTIFGYHIIQVLERKDKEIPAGVTEKDIENQILQEKQGEAVRRWLKPLVDSANIEIIDPALKAYEYRVKRDYPNALIQYQKILANEPQNLLMYIQIARMQEKIGHNDDAYNVLQRGIIWQKYNPQYQYPILYFSIIDFDSKNNKMGEARSYVDNVVKLFGSNLLIMETVSNNYMELISKNAREDLRRKIEELQIKEKEAKAAAAAGQQQQVPLMQDKPQQQQGPVIPKATGK